VGSAAMVLAIRNSIELASIVGRVDHLIDEAMLVLKDLTSKVKELDRRVAELSQEEHLDEFLIFFESELERFELATRIMQTTIYESLRGEFPSELFSEKGREHMVIEMKRIATKMNLRMPLAAQDLYRSRVSAACVDHHLDLFLHVPMLSDVYELHEYQNLAETLPTNGSDVFVVDRISESKYLAVDYGRSVFLELSSTALTNCFRIEEFRICDHGSTVFRKNFASTCISALFVGDHVAIKEHCSIRVRRLKQLEIFEAGEGIFLIQAPFVQKTVIHCQNGTRTEMMITKGIQRFRLDAGCFAVLGDEYRIEHLPSPKSSIEKVESSRAATYQSLLPEESELKDVIDYFSRIETAKLPGKSYVELKEILDSMKNEKEDFIWSVSKWGILVTLGLLLGAFLCVRRCRRRRPPPENRNIVISSPDEKSFNAENFAAHVKI